MNILKELKEDRDLLQKDIANFYNTSIDYLLYETDERKPYTKSIMVKNKVKEKEHIHM